MLPSLFSRRLLFVGVSGLLVITSLLVIMYSFLPKKQTVTDTTDKTSPQVTAQAVSGRVFIKDFYKYSDYFTNDKQLAVEKVLYAYASQGGSTPDLYTGIIRPQPLSQTKDSRGVVTTKFLVDISPVNVTYILGVTGTTKDGPKPVLIQCAPQDQQKNTKVSCIDGMKNRE
jgi:hypothetical protein